jgi:recombination protein RecR
MDVYPDCLKELITQFSTLPGIGKKTAERLSIYMLNANKDKIKDFSSSLDNLKDSIEICKICFCFIENDICHICDDVNRDSTLICVVKEPTDIFLIEKSGFKGKYHVLGGLISPLDGVTPESLNIDTLLNRLHDVREIIMGVDPSNEGDITMLYLSDILKENNIKMTRLARGIPVGSSLEFIDEVTLTHSINDRIEMK